ncbi:MAG TPA: hypothetical protein VFA57_04355 [Pseudolabrys sp.]|nr:hypothetical protein [Pseudolabrys sp.]
MHLLEHTALLEADAQRLLQTLAQSAAITEDANASVSAVVVMIPMKRIDLLVGG